MAKRGGIPSTSRVAGPNPTHSAPLMDCSMPDTCSRCYTRIAPWLTSSACAGHGLLRVQRFSASHRLRIAPRSTLGLPRRAWIAPGLAFPALRVSRFGPCGPTDPCGSLPIQRFCLDVPLGLLRASRRAPRTVRELIRARHLTFRIALGLLRSRRFPPCFARGLLRLHRLALAPLTNCFVRDTWLSTSCPALSLRMEPCPLLPALRLPRIAPLPALNDHCLARTSPRSTLTARTVLWTSPCGSFPSRYSALAASRGLLRVPHLSPGVSLWISPSLTLSVSCWSQ